MRRRRKRRRHGGLVVEGRRPGIIIRGAEGWEVVGRGGGREWESLALACPRPWSASVSWLSSVSLFAPVSACVGVVVYG